MLTGQSARGEYRCDAMRCNQAFVGVQILPREEAEEAASSFCLVRPYEPHSMPIQVVSSTLDIPFFVERGCRVPCGTPFCNAEYSSAVPWGSEGLVLNGCSRRRVKESEMAVTGVIMRWCEACTPETLAFLLLLILTHTRIDNYGSLIGECACVSRQATTERRTALLPRLILQLHICWKVWDIGRKGQPEFKAEARLEDNSINSPPAIKQVPTVGGYFGRMAPHILEGNTCGRRVQDRGSIG